MSEIDFDEPLWMVEIYHQQPGQSAAVWGRALNADNEEDALQKAAKLFVDDDLNWAYVTEVRPSELKGGENVE